jgi:hypothetical protein
VRRRNKGGRVPGNMFVAMQYCSSILHVTRSSPRNVLRNVPSRIPQNIEISLRFIPSLEKGAHVTSPFAFRFAGNIDELRLFVSKFISDYDPSF